jgi:hypothetical protein
MRVYSDEIMVVEVNDSGGGEDEGKEGNYSGRKRRESGIPGISGIQPSVALLDGL